MGSRIARAARTALPIGVATAVLSAVIAVSRWSRFSADPLGVLVAVVGISVVVFLSYVAFSVAGYPVGSDGTAPVPRAIAWGIVAVAALLLVAGMVGLALFTQRTQ